MRIFSGLIIGFFFVLMCSAARGNDASPVQIDRCRLEYSSGLTLVKSTGALQIKFTNESKKSADVIRFGIAVDDKVASVRDVGVFSPGVTVNHRFKDYAGDVSFVFSRQPQPVCRVTFVHFTDDTAWEAPEVVPSPRAPGNGPSLNPLPSATAAASASPHN